MRCTSSVLGLERTDILLPNFKRGPRRSNKQLPDGGTQQAHHRIALFKVSEAISGGLEDGHSYMIRTMYNMQGQGKHRQAGRK